jgi:hypothetical protein
MTKLHRQLNAREPVALSWPGVLEEPVGATSSRDPARVEAGRPVFRGTPSSALPPLAAAAGLRDYCLKGPELVLRPAPA